MICPQQALFTCTVVSTFIADQHANVVFLFSFAYSFYFLNCQVAMRALGFEPKKEEIKKMISDIDKDGSGISKMKSINFYITCTGKILVDGRELLRLGIFPLC